MNDRFHTAIASIDAENSQDPRQELVGGESVPRELLYSKRLTEWILRLDPSASEALRLAARSQHICRWKIPRSEYPATRVGYHQWKSDLKSYHARLTEQILTAVGYDTGTIQRVRALNLKEGFPADAECRTLEDALCLVFLEHQFADLAQKAEPGKVVNALRKSWKKMTPKARNEALLLSYTPVQNELLQSALEIDQALS